MGRIPQTVFSTGTCMNPPHWKRQSHAKSYVSTQAMTMPHANVLHTSSVKMSILNVCVDLELVWLDFPGFSPGTSGWSSAHSSPFTVHKALDMFCNILWILPCWSKLLKLATAVQRNNVNMGSLHKLLIHVGGEFRHHHSKASHWNIYHQMINKFTMLYSYHYLVLKARSLKFPWNCKVSVRQWQRAFYWQPFRSKRLILEFSWVWCGLQQEYKQDSEYIK